MIHCESKSACISLCECMSICVYVCIISHNFKYVFSKTRLLSVSACYAMFSFKMGAVKAFLCAERIP